MSVTVTHDDEYHIIIISYEGTWEWSAYLNAAYNAVDLAGEHAITMIHDFTDSEPVPDTLLRNLALTDALPLPANLARLVAVGVPEGSRVLRLVSRNRLMVELADCLQEALTGINTKVA